MTSRILRRIDALARITDEPGRLTRTFASPAMRRANDLVAGWMREAGMRTREDPIGNLIGHYAGSRPGARVLLLGSHLDTVRDAGKFDGPLGVLLAVACVHELHRRRQRLPFAIEVVGFADEEGVRYQTACLGSAVLAGAFDERNLEQKDADGIRMAEAIRRFGGNPARLRQARVDARKLVGYLEAHIEQGPGLERRNLPVGVVTAIAGQSRLQVEFHGTSGHAGTVPMSMRRDALAGAAEFVLAVERCGITATVGWIEVREGAGNVIPGHVICTLDVRDQRDARRRAAVGRLRARAKAIAKRRRLKLTWSLVQETAAVRCDRRLSRHLSKCVAEHCREVLALPSGAGHDAAIMATVTPVAMLFVRCRGGVSHHPDESAAARDIRVALEVMSDFLESQPSG
jgi:allantoate deiminase